MAFPAQDRDDIVRYIPLFFSLTATEASEAGPLAGPFPSRQAGNRQVAISLARGMLFRAAWIAFGAPTPCYVLISLARVMLFREYPSGTRINKGFQAAVGNNCTQKHLIEF